MATYKIPQNVEAEDKLIGPFSFKQFVFLIIASIGILLAFLFFRIQPLLVIIPLPVVVVFLILGLYHREDQPVETFLLAALNFNLKPRRRVWDTEGLTESIRITAPKRFRAAKVKRLGAQEQSQLQRLAKIVDTRGWSIKRPELTEQLDEHTLDADDRLATQALATTTEPLDVHANDDMLDPYNNPRAQDFTQLADSSQQQARQQAIVKMQTALDQSNGKAGAGQLSSAQPPVAADNQTPPAVSYNPYPAMQQKVVGAPANSGGTDNANAILNLSKNSELMVSQIADQAQRQVKHNGSTNQPKSTNQQSPPGGTNATT